MILLNFSHPLTELQREQIESLTSSKIAQVLAVPTQFDEATSFVAQISHLMESVDLNTTQWQSEAILVMLPSLNFIAALLLAELHGRMGYFPAVVRTRPVADSVPRRYEVAEILNLQGVRELARKQR